MNVIEALRVKDGLSDTEASVADYILQHVDDVTRMNIGDLARSAHCSNSGVVRLCQKLGLQGFRELRVELARSIERTRTSALEVNPDRPFIEGYGTRDIASSIASLSKQAIDATYASVATADIRKAARLILGARHVAYYAAGDSLASTEVFTTLLLKIGVICTPGLIKEDYTAVGQFLDARDLALVVTYSGVTVKTLERVLGPMQARGVRTIIVTADDSVKKRMISADCVITLPTGESRSERLATFYSQACVRYALNCIYAEAYAANYERNRQTWEELLKMEGEA